LDVGSGSTTLSLTRHAKPKKDKPALAVPVMDDAFNAALGADAGHKLTLTMIDLTRQVELQYCRAKRSYFPGDCANAPPHRG
jgi:hypothetical protein